MRTLSGLAVVGLLLISAPAFAQTRTQAEEVIRTSTNSRGLSVRGTLRALLRNAGLPYEVQGDVPEVPITLKLRNVPLTDAIRVLVRHAQFSMPGVEVAERDGKYSLSSAVTAPPAIADTRPDALPSAEPAPPLLEKRTVDVAGMHLAEALEQHFDAVDLSFAIDPDVPDAITPALPQEPSTLWDGIQQVLAAARAASGELYVARVGEIYVISRKPGAARTGAVNKPQVGEEPAIHLLLRDMPLRVAIHTLFRETPYQYAINPDVPNVPVTVEIQAIGISAALRALVRAAGKQVPGLTYSKG